MPEMSSDRSRMLRENSSIAARKRALVEDDLDEIDPHAGADDADRPLGRAHQRLEGVADRGSRQVAVAQIDGLRRPRAARRRPRAGGARPPPRTAIACAPTPSRSRASSSSDRRSSGAASRTSAAICAAASRSFSQCGGNSRPRARRSAPPRSSRTGSSGRGGAPTARTGVAERPGQRERPLRRSSPCLTRSGARGRSSRRSHGFWAEAAGTPPPRASSPPTGSDRGRRGRRGPAPSGPSPSRAPRAR